MNRECKKIIIFDLDGTLIRNCTANKLYKEGYLRTIAELEKSGRQIPGYLKKHSYENFCRLSQDIKEMYEIFKEKYLQVLKENKIEIEKEKPRARKIIELTISKYNPKEIYILSANPHANYISKILVPCMPDNNILTVEGINYYQKEKVLQSLKKSQNGTTEIIYIGDLEWDGEIAENVGVKFLNIKEIENVL